MKFREHGDIRGDGGGQLGTFEMHTLLLAINLGPWARSAQSADKAKGYGPKEAGTGENCGL